MNGIIIRHCLAEDIPALVTIYREFVSFHSVIDPIFIKVPETPSLFARYVEMNMQGDSSRVLVAVSGDFPTGFCIGRIMMKPPVYLQPVFGEIDTMAVLEAYQRRGIGTGLFREMMQWFSANNITRVELNVALGNEKSSGFWRKMGMRPFLEVMSLSVPAEGHRPEFR